MQTRPSLLADPRIGEVYLSQEEIQARIEELGAEIAADYQGREPILVAPLKTAVVFVADLSRALAIVHNLDFIALAGYDGSGGGGRQVRLLKDLSLSINGRHVLLVEDVVDTGLTLNYLAKTLQLREPASLAAVTLLDRPYRRLCEGVPVRYVGFTVPDEFFVGYGFDLDERYRNLPDLRLLNPAASPFAAERALPVPPHALLE
ncbi:MAG: hypoxanthine phosphoribosyltransferase [Gaiellales bacterium]